MKFIAALALFLTTIANAYANPQLDNAVLYLQQNWDIANFQLTDKKTKVAELERLAATAEKAVTTWPESPELKIWQAIILSTLAGEDGGLSALPKVKKAKALLEEVEVTNPTAMNGSIYTSLGSLYYKVPGWPIAFGDNLKAQTYLEHALKQDPYHMDANYFYADYLFEQGEYQRAAQFFQFGLSLPGRPDRPLYTAGRKQQMREGLAKAQAKIN